MRCYLVTFHCVNGEGVVDFIKSFYVEDTIQLAEEMMEYQEEIEETLDLIVISKDIEKVRCER